MNNSSDPIEEALEITPEEVLVPDEEIDYVKDIQGKNIRDIQEEVVDKPKKEEPVVETPVVEPKVEPKVEEPKEEVIDADEMAKSIAEKVREELKSKEEITQETKDKYDELVAKLEKEGKEPSWKDVAKLIKEEAIEEIKQERIREQEEIEKHREEERKVTEKLTEKFNANLDEELEEMYKSGELTPIKDQKNPSDQGVIERKSLFQTMLTVNQERAAQGKEPIMSLARIRYSYWTKPTAQPAGADAPISMGKGGPSSDEPDEEIDYNRDVKKSWASFKRIIPN